MILQTFHTTYCEETINDYTNQADSFITSVTAVKAASTCKLVRLLPDRRMVRLIMELVGNYTFTTANGKRSRLRRLKNCVQVQQGFVLVTLLFSIYTSDLPTTVQNACMRQRPSNHACWWRLTNSGKGAKQRHCNRIGEYLQTWKLKLSTTKAVLAVFHLNNKEAKRELEVNHNNETPLLWSESTYLGVTLDRTPRTADSSSHFAKSWHHALHSSGVLLASVGVLEQQRCEQPP